MTHSRAAQRWAERLQRFSQSEMTVAQFCAAEGVSQPSYYHWRRKLLGPVKAAGPASPPDSGPTPALVPVRIVDSQGQQAPPPKTNVRATVQLPGGVSIEVQVLGSDASEAVRP